MMNTITANASNISTINNHMTYATPMQESSQHNSIPFNKRFGGRYRSIACVVLTIAFVGSLAGLLTGCGSLGGIAKPSNDSGETKPQAPNNTPQDVAETAGTMGGTTGGTDASTKAQAWLVPDQFANVPGWANGNQGELLSAFIEQCQSQAERNPSSASASPFYSLCNLAKNKPTEQSPKAFLEQHLMVYQMQQTDGQKKGLLTGYYEPLLKGSRTQVGPYQTPLYAPPRDLLTIALEPIAPELKGKRLRGRLDGNAVVPFYNREEWLKVAKARHEKPLVWIEDKLDAFLLQVQGSGRVVLNDGKVMRLNYADQNGHPYKAIGRVLVDRKELTTEQATIPGIRDWAKRNPEKVDELLNTNPSVVFFKENKTLLPSEGPIGAMGLPLTGGISIAVDRTLVPYGSMLWIDSTHPIDQQPLQRGMLAQDTGGAIRGRIRADYYWGTGPKAGEAAGLTRQPLQMWLLWPKGATPPSLNDGQS